MTLDRGSSHPVYLQIEEQVRFMIESGQLSPGSKLPSAQQLADNLSINRNTVLSAYAELARAGHVYFLPGRGTFVASQAPQAVFSPAVGEFLEAIAGPLQRVLQAGARPDELGLAVQAHARTLATSTLAVVTAGLFECNQDRLTYYATRLRETLQIEIEPFLIGDLDRPDDVIPRLATCDFLVSTFFHLAEVRHKVRRLPEAVQQELFAIAIQPHLSVLSQIANLPQGSILGIVYCEDESFTEQRLQAMKDAITHAQEPNIAEVRTILVHGVPSADTFRGLSAVLVRPENKALLPDWLPRSIPVIEFANVLDAASVQMLREVVHEFREAKQERTKASAQAGAGEPVPAMTP
jgi:GntR family transcriptional regulator